MVSLRHDPDMPFAPRLRGFHLPLALAVAGALGLIARVMAMRAGHTLDIER